MAFDSTNAVARALRSARDVQINKVANGSQIQATYCSFWRSNGFPGAGAIPGAAAICNDALAGCLPIPARSGGQERALLWSGMFSSQGNSLSVMDRLGHMGGLSGTVTTAQTVNLDVTGTGDNLVARRGPTDYTAVRWFLEWYTATGATIVNATVAVTYNDLSTGNIVVALSASMVQGRMFEIQTANGQGVRSVQSVTLSATTGTAGSFGVTAAVELAAHPLGVSSVANFDWAQLGLPLVQDNSCLMLCALMAASVTSGSLGGRLRIGVD